MEAGGIEPPSRDGSGETSTRVVGRLFLERTGAGRQAPVNSSPTVSRPRDVRRTARTSPLSSSRGIAGVSRATGYLVLGSHGVRVVAM